jgi:hypothetical protein
MILHRILPALALIAASLPAPALASTPLMLKADQTQVMTMDAPPGTVVVGNPSIADITIEGNQLFLHGRGFGTTNLIIFDTKGNVAYDFEVTVQDGGGSDLTIISGNAAMQTYSCAPVCQVTLHVGDNASYFGNALSMMSAKSGFAMGAKASDGSTSGTGTPPPAQ